MTKDGELTRRLSISLYIFDCRIDNVHVECIVLDEGTRPLWIFVGISVKRTATFQRNITVFYMGIRFDIC